MATGNGFHTKVVIISRRESDNKSEKWKTKKYNFQGKSERSRRWFDLDHEWLKENFMTREPDFYGKLYQTKFRGDDTKNFKYLEYQLVMQKKKKQFHP